MFEQSLENMTATIYLESKQVALLDERGVGKFQVGWVKLTYLEAVELVEKMERLSPSVPKRLFPRYRSTLDQIKCAFGPEFLERH